MLPLLPANSLHVCVTSPPYWGLRRYLPEGDPLAAHELGNEAVPDCNGAFTGSPCGACWVCRLVAVCREVRRVLRPDGTLWLNCGDAFARSGPAPPRRDHSNGSSQGTYGQQGYSAACAGPARPALALRDKNLLLLPSRLALALQADGWWLRSEIIWHKLNAMPESVTDRPTKAHEQVFLFTKSPRYFYDGEAVREPHAEPGRLQINSGKRHESALRHQGVKALAAGNTNGYHPAGRACRSVWPLASEPTPFAHFAAFPSALVRRCLLAAVSAGGVCKACGAPYRRLVAVGTPNKGTTRGQQAWTAVTGQRESAGGLPRRPVTTSGFAPACQCAAGVTSAVCLDPFMGSGTTLLTARHLFIRSLGVDLNPTYCALAASRLRQGVLALQPGVC